MDETLKMDYSSSEGSEDEEEILRNYDEEAKIIVQSETLPPKSLDRYLLIYNTYKKWREENQNSLYELYSDEMNLIAYFETLKVKLKPPTLWSIWSMLRKTLNVKDNVDISNFVNLKNFIKTNAKGYKPKKTFVLRWKEIVKFMNEAPDNIYLAMKVILVFGVCGYMTCDEITNMKVEDIEDLGNQYLVSISYNKSEYAEQFIIGNLYYDKVKKYISLRPPGQFSDRFFIKYKKGRCFRQPIGRHTIAEVPENIASCLELPNVNRYNGHCFRRTSAMLLSVSGADMEMIKQLGRWRSDLIGKGYIKNSMRNRQLIYDGYIQKATTTNTLSIPSTSAQVTIEYENDYVPNDEDVTQNSSDVTPKIVIIKTEKTNDENVSDDTEDNSDDETPKRKKQNTNAKDVTQKSSEKPQKSAKRKRQETNEESDECELIKKLVSRLRDRLREEAKETDCDLHFLSSLHDRFKTIDSRLKPQAQIEILNIIERYNRPRSNFYSFESFIDENSPGHVLRQDPLS